MFNWFHKAKPEEDPFDVLEFLQLSVTKASLSDLAIEKAAGMIAKAVAKSEFKIWNKGKEIKNDAYWCLNIQPNPNESATEFWLKAVRKLLTNEECVIVPLHNDQLYIAESYTCTQTVTFGKIYKDIEIQSAGDSMRLDKFFSASELVVLRFDDGKISRLLKNNLKLYNNIASAMIASKKFESVPKLALDVETALPVIRTKDENGAEVSLTVDQYKEKIRKLLESEDIAIITNQQGLKLEKLDVAQGIAADEISKIAKEIFVETAYAFDIPKSVFLGEITEKADSTNEFITYAVNWVVEIINDALNATLIGKEEYLKGNEKISIDLTKYKHVDILESASNLDKLRGIGFNLDELFEMIGREPIGTEFSTYRALTKNYGTEEMAIEK